MPTLPPPDGMHVIVVHFPIALLMVAPLFVLAGAVTGLRSMMVSALILMVLGTAGAFAATNTGEEAMNTMGVLGDFPSDGAKYDVAYEVLDEHMEAGHLVRNLFAGVTLFYAVVVAITLLVPKFKKIVPRVVLHLLFLALWVYPTILLANVAHDGGRLVHEFELHSVLAETADGEPDYEAELAEYEESEVEESEVEEPEAEVEEEAEDEDPSNAEQPGEPEEESDGGPEEGSDSDPEDLNEAA